MMDPARWALLNESERALLRKGREYRDAREIHPGMRRGRVRIVCDFELLDAADSLLDEQSNSSAPDLEEAERLRARVAELESSLLDYDKRTTEVRQALRGLPEVEPYPDDPDIDDHERSLRTGGRVIHPPEQIRRLRVRLAALESAPVVPRDFEVELMNASGPDDAPFMQWGFGDGTTSDGETSNDDMPPEYRSNLAQMYRALAWAIEHNARPPHAGDRAEVEP